METNIILVLCLAIPTYFLWATIHELSHVIVYHFMCKVHSWSIKPYPHKYRGSIRFAGYSVWCDSLPDKYVQWKYALAPRVMNVLACLLLLPLTVILTGWIQVVCIVLCAGGVLDLIVGSLGIRRYSDLQIASDSLDLPYNVLRVTGLVYASVPIFMTVVLYL